MYSNIEDAWKTSNDLDKFKNAYNPPVEIKNATNELVSSSESSEKISTPSPAIFKKEVKELKLICDRDFKTIGKLCNLNFKFYN
jgi:hypothetical protein